jgi:predicted SAM-dependent methyltransferase
VLVMARPTNVAQRIGGALQQYPLAYRATLVGLQGVARARRRRQISDYLKTHQRRFLRVGSGSHTDPGWLSVDLVPVSASVVFMDVTKPLPLPSDSFDAVQCEHVIEHIPYRAGQTMLREIHRVLRPGGTLRIATPNLDLVRRLIDRTDDDPALAAYVEQSNRRFGARDELAEVTNPAFTANRLVREWGHTFLYDEPTLRRALGQAGFSQIVSVAPGESEHPELRGVDRHEQEVGRGPNELETLALEACA